jgi:hypothetical protein
MGNVNDITRYAHAILYDISLKVVVAPFCGDSLRTQ